MKVQTAWWNPDPWQLGQIILIHTYVQTIIDLGRFLSFSSYSSNWKRKELVRKWMHLHNWSNYRGENAHLGIQFENRLRKEWMNFIQLTNSFGFEFSFIWNLFKLCRVEHQKKPPKDRNLIVLLHTLFILG